jgi:hypothetical protein
MVDEQIYNLLKKVARKEIGTKGIIFYSDLAHLAGRPFSDISEREELFETLGEISEYEVNFKKRPMLSVVVVHNDKLRMPGEGFFKLAVHLGKWDGKGDKLIFFGKELEKVHSCWAEVKD